MLKTKLIVLRGPLGSGKSSVAKAVRASQGERMAIVEQDYLRRILLKEKDVPNGLNIDLIKQTTLFLLKHSYHVIMEGIFYEDRYSVMVAEIIQQHPTNNYFFYFDISFEETLHRHEFKPNKSDFGEKEMKEWFKEKDFLKFVKEEVISEEFNLDEIVDYIIKSSDLAKVPFFFT